jgi:V/A-type H+/Na+-transporting ATPase subunit E
MTGLERIVKQIEEDATVAANAVIADAKAKAEEILNSAKIEADKKHAEIIDKSKLDVTSSLNRAESAANLQEKKLILNAKLDIINNVIKKAKNSLIDLPDNEYFDVIIKIIQKYALDQSGQIVFSATDKNRLPVNFDEKVTNALKGKDGAVLTISEKTCNIDGGIILVYGDVEVNCSFDALFAAAKETLQDKVCQVLFE